MAADIAVQNRENYGIELKAWMSANMLKLNDDKTEAVLFGSKTQQSKVSVNSTCVGESEISVCSLVRDLCLLMDSNITLHHHVNAAVRTCHSHFRTLGKLRPFLTVSLVLSSTAIAVCGSR